MQFQDLKISPVLLEVLEELGYENPTPIQASSIPILLSGQDLIGQSKTGSGKTAAFALPVLQNLRLECMELQALVVCPTRELCAQVARDFRALGRRHSGLRVLVVAGGQPLEPQTRALLAGVHIVVGTPGRLLDHCKRGGLVTGQVGVVVLDEADRMLEMGFEADMKSILDSLPRTRQTVLFSATFPDSIEAMSSSYQSGAQRVSVESPEESLPQISQVAIPTTPDRKISALYWALQQFPHESALVFCNFKKSVRELEEKLKATGMSVGCLHGDLDQFHRDQMLVRFRNRSIRILVATDVASRGLDVEDLDLVINYELPSQPEVYIHRIGRTGRAGKVGSSVALASSKDRAKLAAIESLLGVSLDRKVPELGNDGDIARLTQSLARDAPMVTILISGGRKEKIRPGDILGALTGDAGGLRGNQIGKIEIHDRLSYVAVSKEAGQRATKGLNRGRIKGKRFRATLI